MPKPNDAQGILLMLGASFAFAAMAAATKWIGGALPASEVVFVRSFLGTVVLAAILTARGAKDWIGKRPIVLGARGVIGFTALILYFWCIPHIHLGTAVMLNYTAPIFAVFIAHFFFHDKNTRKTNFWIAMAFVGVYLVTSPQLGEEPAALLAGLGSGLLAGIVHLLIRKSHDEDEPPLLIIFYFTAICSLGSLLVGTTSNWRMPTSPEWVALLAITGTSLLGQAGLTYSLQKAPVSVVSVFGYITPVISLAIGYVVWKENPGLAGIAGSAIVILCGVVLYKKRATKTDGI